MNLLHQLTKILVIAALAVWFQGNSAAQDSIVKKDSIAQIDATVFLVNQQPFFARMIQHNGESFAFLKSIGFNVVQLQACATNRQLDEARLAGIWLVCPPPSSTGLHPIPFNFDPVIAWTARDDATIRHSQLIAETIREIRASDRRAGRPVMASISSHCETLARIVDVPLIGRPTTGTSFRASDYSDWIAARTQVAAKPFWADLPTHAPQGLNRQALAMGINADEMPLQHQQLKFLLYEAIAGGARGLRFRSQTRLDLMQPITQLRVLSLRWLMNHIDQIEPWIGGGLLQPMQSRSESEKVYQLRLADSKLILAQRTTGLEQFVAGDLPPKRLEFANAFTSVSDRAYQIDELGARLISRRGSATGNQLAFENFSCTAAALVTQSPGPIAMINQAVTAESFQNRLQLTQQSLALVQLLQQNMLGLGMPATPATQSSIDSALQQIRNAQQLISQGNEERALATLETADAMVAFVRRGWLESRFDPSSGVAISPLVMNAGMLAHHDAFSGRLAGSNWNPNALTAGDFENLKQMLDSGWLNRREDLSQIKTLVTLDKSAAVDGRYGLKMAATSDAAMRFVPAPPIWIRSANVAVKAGRLVRIHGYVNIPVAIQGSHDGLMIVDSLGGKGLASRIRQTDGWKEFTLYRAAERDGDMNVTIYLTGIGTALVDEVTIRTLDPAAAEVQAQNESPKIK